jgi:hypothetical protein
VDYSQYTTRPQKFSSRESARLKKIKAALGRGAGGAEGRLRKEMRGLYKTGAKRVAPYSKPQYGDGSYSPQQIDQQVVSGVRTKYGHDIDATGARQQQIGKYYDDWNAELGQMRNQAAQAQQSMIEETINAQKTVGAAEQSGNQNLLAQMQADAAKRGQQIDPSLFLKANQASAARATSTNTQAAKMGQIKQAGDQWYVTQGLVNRASKQGALDKERTYTSRLRSDAADYATGLRRELGQEGFDRAIASKTLNFKISDARSADDLQRQQMSISQQNADSNSQRADWATSPNNPDNQAEPPKSPYAKKDYVTKRDETRVLLRRHKENKDAKKLSARDWIDSLVTDGVPEDLARAMYLDAKYGGVDRQTRSKINKKYGYALRVSKSERAKKS